MANSDDEWVWNTQITFHEECSDWDEWDKPADPFRIYGDTYYVGTCGIGAILIVGEDGHTLIDSGTEAGAEIVLANIRKVGVDPQDIVLLLSSHEHFDHVGGMATVQEATGGVLVSSPIGIEVMSTGEDHPQDPQYGMHDPMRPVVGGIAFQSGEARRLLSQIGITPIETPGHTPGAMSWSWESCESNVCRTIVYADSMGPVSSDSYRFSDHTEYLVRYRAGIASLAALDCDVLVTPHPSASQMLEKLAADDLRSGMGCAQYAAAVTVRLDARLEREAGANQ